MLYEVLDTKTIDYSFLEKISQEDKKLMGMIFDIAKSQVLYLQLIRMKKENFDCVFVRDTNGNFLVTDNRSNSIKFKKTSNINRKIDLRDLINFDFNKC